MKPETQTIYRIELPCNTGCYESGLMHKWSTKDHFTLRTPTLQEDTELLQQIDMAVDLGVLDSADDTHWLFGFTHVEHLLAWFDTQELVNLADLGFRLSVYTVPWDYHVSSDKQAMFDHSEADLVSQHDPYEYFYSNIIEQRGVNLNVA